MPWLATKALTKIECLILCALKCFSLIKKILMCSGVFWLGQIWVVYSPSAHTIRITVDHVLG